MCLFALYNKYKVNTKKIQSILKCRIMQSTHKVLEFRDEGKFPHYYYHQHYFFEMLSKRQLEKEKQPKNKVIFLSVRL